MPKNFSRVSCYVFDALFFRACFLAWSIVAHATVFAQDHAPKDVLSKIRQALEESRSINCVSLKGMFVDNAQLLIYPSIKFERLGSKLFFCGEEFVYDQRSKDKVQEASRQHYEKSKSLLGNSGDSWLIYDGTFVARYDLRKFLFNKSTDEGIAKNHTILTHFEPDNWDRPGYPLKNSSVWALVGSREINFGQGILVKIQYDGETDKVHAFSGEISGPFAGKKLAFTNFRISFDENQGWHWTRFESEKEDGEKVIADRVWKFKEGFWYPAHSSVGYSKPMIKFEINDIEFGSENIMSSFSWNENDLPLGIRIVEGPVGSESPERFSGGEEGERQYRLIRRAEMLKRKNEKGASNR